MLKIKDKNLAAYRGDYHPVEMIKNGQKIHGFDILGMSGDETTFENTYNDHITIYGKSENMHGVNLCPAPESKTGSYQEADAVYNFSFTAKENGYFDFNGAMAAGELITRTTLKPGIYTVSGCKYILLWWKERGDFFEIPGTFTLEKETEVTAYFWYTKYETLDLKDQYIQIEKGETATEYSPFVGNSDFLPSPNNYRPLVSAGGTVRCEGGNLLSPEFTDADKWFLDVGSTTANSKAFDLDLQPGKYVFSFENHPLTTYIFLYLQKSNDDWQTATAISHPIMNYSIVNKIEFEVKTGHKYRFWCWRLENNFDLFYNWQIRRKATPDKYYPPHNPVISKISELKGIKVDATSKYNYCESGETGDIYYISDKLIKNKIVRRVGTVTLNGTEVITEKVIDDPQMGCYCIDFSSYFKNNRNFDYGLCNYFKRLSLQDVASQGMALGMEDKNLYLFLNKTKFPNSNAVSVWLKEIYEKEKPMTILYLLDDAEDELIEAENALKSFPEFTRLMVTNSEEHAPLGMAKCIKIQKS